MATYLITGAAGFIGSRVAEMLCDSGHKVIGIDNLNDYYDVRLKEYRVNHVLQRQPSFQFEKMDIEDRFELNRLFRTHAFDAVLNLAARAGVRYSMENPHVYVSTNVTGTLNLLEQMHESGVNKLVLASTSSLYAGLEMPFEESLPTETPISAYAATKKSAELLAYSYHHLYKMDVSVVRYFTVYGPAGRPDMSYFRFIQCIEKGEPITVFGDGSQSRDFTYVDDVAQGTINAIQNVGYEVFNLGRSERPVSINSLIGRIESELSKKANVEYLPAHKADMQSTYANVDKATSVLKWTPLVGLDEGVKRCVDWYRENLILASDISLETGVGELGKPA